MEYKIMCGMQQTNTIQNNLCFNWSNTRNMVSLYVYFFRGGNVYSERTISINSQNLTKYAYFLVIVPYFLLEKIKIYVLLRI